MAINLRLFAGLLGLAVHLTACGNDAQTEGRPASPQAIAVAPVSLVPQSEPPSEAEVGDYTGLPAPRSLDPVSKPVWKSQIFARLPSEVLIVDRTERGGAVGP
jgi:hypothetical protein